MVENLTLRHKNRHINELPMTDLYLNCMMSCTCTLAFMHLIIMCMTFAVNMAMKIFHPFFLSYAQGEAFFLHSKDSFPPFCFSFRTHDEHEKLNPGDNG